MKEQTPMQELKSTIEDMINNGGTEEDLYAVIAHIDNTYLEKEKKMVIDAYSSGFVSGKWQTDGNDNIYHAKKYFNNKYNAK